MAHLRPYSKQLTCPDCGDVIGEARLRPMTGWLIITQPGGGMFGASEGGVQLRVAEARLHAAAPEEQATAQRQLAWVRRHLGEQIYDLHCPRGHQLFVTTPQIARAMSRAGGAWAALPGMG